MNIIQYKKIETEFSYSTSRDLNHIFNAQSLTIEVVN